MKKPDGFFAVRIQRAPPRRTCLREGVFFGGRFYAPTRLPTMRSRDLSAWRFSRGRVCAPTRLRADAFADDEAARFVSVAILSPVSGSIVAFCQI
jgi:hypothetical protein